MAESIKVCCRFRADKKDEELDDWEFVNEQNLIKLREKKFTFDQVLDPQTTQEDMYEKVAVKTIEDFCSGYHGTLFAYGNSGSGKTFSIVGPDEIVEFLSKDFTNVPEDIQKLYGIIPRATIHIFNAINNYIENGGSAFLKASYIEIYNESITCLLNQKENLKVHEIPKVGFSVSGKEEVSCSKPEDIFKVLYTGTKNKTVGGTLQNARSSRSHTLLSLDLKIKTVDGSERHSKLNIVDLAGSEKLKNTGASTPERIKEAQKINQSLTTLGMCIMALTEANSFVPFRNSKLTLLLKECLGGNSKTTLLCAARRDKKLVDDNLNSLGFAVRAKSIKTKSVKNVTLSEKEYQYLVDAMKGEIGTLRKQIGKDFHKITDPKLLAILNNDFGLNDGENKNDNEISINSNSNSNMRNKRTSLINLSEDEIIIKYCELRGKYDNLLQSSGNKILELNSRVENPRASIINDKEYIKYLADKEMYNNEIKEAKSKLSDLEEKETQCAKDKKKLNEEITELKGDVDGLQSMLDLNATDIEAMGDQVTELENKNKKQEEEISELKETSKKLEDLTNKNNLLSEEKVNLSIKHDEYKEQINKEIDNLNKTIADKQSLEDKLNSDNNSLKTNLEQNESAIKKLETDNLNINNNNNSFKADIEKLKLENSNIINNSDLLKSEIERLKKIETEKISDQEIFAEKDKLLQETKTTLESRIKQILEDAEKSSNNQLEQSKLLNEEKLQLNNKYDDLLKEKNALEDNSKLESNKLKNLEEKLKEENEKYTKEIEAKNSKIKEVENSSLVYLENEKKANENSNNLEQKLSKLKTEYENNTNDHQDKNNTNLKKIAELNNELKTKDSKEKDLLSQIEKLKEELAKGNNDYSEIKKDNTHLEQKINEMNKVNDSLKYQNQKYVIQIEEIQKRGSLSSNISEVSNRRTSHYMDQKVDIKKNIFANLKKTDSVFLKEAKVDAKKVFNLSKNLINLDQVEYFNKLRENIDQVSPRTVSSHNSDLDEMPDFDYNDPEGFEKMNAILKEKERKREEARQLKELEKKKSK